MCAWLPYLLLILKEYSWNLLWICTFLGFFGEDLYGKDCKDPSRRLFRSDMIVKWGKTRLTNILHGPYFASFILLPNPPFFWCGEMPFFFQDLWCSSDVEPIPEAMVKTTRKKRRLEDVNVFAYGEPDGPSGYIYIYIYYGSTMIYD